MVGKEIKPKKVSENEKKMFISSNDPYDGPLAWWESECVKYAISHEAVRWRLIELMESETVRLTDRKYMMLLMSRIQQNREEKQRSRVEVRKLPPPSKISELLEMSYNAILEKEQYESSRRKSL